LYAVPLRIILFGIIPFSVVRILDF
jgi:hypothetical protein